MKILKDFCINRNMDSIIIQQKKVTLKILGIWKILHNKILFPI